MTLYIETTAELLNRILIWQSLQFKGLQFEDSTDQRKHFDGLFTFRLNFIYDFGGIELI